MKNNLFEQAQKFLNQNEFKRSFRLFQNIAESTDSSNEEKSDSYNMMGALVLIDPELDPEDETGLRYFIKSIEFDDCNIGALLNIIETFGVSFTSHKNTSILDFAINKIQTTDYNLSDRDKEMIESKLKIRDEILKN
jgi:hypothetical protein